MDAESEFLVQKALDKIYQDGKDGTRAKMSVLIIAHKLSTVINADNIIVLGKGRVVEQGTHRELIRKRGLYAELCRKQGADLAPHDEAAVERRKREGGALASMDENEAVTPRGETLTSL